MALSWSFFFSLAFLISIPFGCLASNSYERSSVQRALFVFGDSLFDTGNNNYINTTAQFQANYSPYGESFFNPPSGRFCDGRVIPDFIAEYAELPLIRPYFGIGKGGIDDGVNFASGGSGCLVETSRGFVIDLKTQLRYFQKVAKDLKKKFGAKKSKRLLSSAVYIFNTGSNDYFNLLHAYSKEEFVEMVTGNLTYVLKGIYQEGGRKFGILNLGALACTPGSRALKFLQGNKSGNCFEETTSTLAKMHNSVLAKMLKQLEEQLPGFKYAFYDLFKVIRERFENPSKYGFKTSKIACCGTGPFRGIPSCGGKGPVKEYTLCKNVKDHIFFDFAHLTEAAYKQHAELLWNGTTDVVEPYNLKSLFDLST